MIYTTSETTATVHLRDHPSIPYSTGPQPYRLSGIAVYGLYPEREWMQVTPLSKPVSIFRPKTELAARLWEIRQRIIASGTPLLDWDGVRKEVAEQRGKE
jgi:hypothetical protein